LNELIDSLEISQADIKALQKELDEKAKNSSGACKV
jgi:hypothetical protein